METERLIMNFPKDLKKKLKFLAVKNDTNVTSIVIEAVEKYLTSKK